MSRKKGVEERTRETFKAAKHASVGLEFAVAVVICYFIGDWFDGKFDVAPWGVIGGVVHGFATGVKRLIDINREVTREDHDDGA